MFAYPTAEWIARQITEAFPWNEVPRYLIRGPFHGGMSVAASALSDTILVKKGGVPAWGADGIVRRDTGRKAGAKAALCRAAFRRPA
jgi:hypothetical protein